MKAWTKLKQILNEGNDIIEDDLKDKIFITNKITYKTFRSYLHLLTEIGFIGHWRGYFKLRLHHSFNLSYYSFNLSYFKLIRKIPKKLTIIDARKMKLMPWLEWFKYLD